MKIERTIVLTLHSEDNTLLLELEGEGWDGGVRLVVVTAKEIAEIPKIWQGNTRAILHFGEV